MTGSNVRSPSFRKKLLPAEMRYDAVSRECLGIIYGLKYNRPYILGREITIANDNKPLLWLLQTATPSQRVARWQIILSEYRITNFKHLPGRINNVADALSRYVAEKDTVDQLLEDIPTISLIKSSNEEESEVIDWNVEKLASTQNKVNLYRHIKE